jgi:acyl-coenzyme A synthetase/AMP-(fatty) acid ligase
VLDGRDIVDYLRALDAPEVAVHLPSMPERNIAIDACRAAGKTVVALDARPRIVITADAAVAGGVVRNLKDEVDAAVPDAERVIVFRHAGDAALAPTLDAYLDVVMIPGRDIWVDQVGASG